MKTVSRLIFGANSGLLLWVALASASPVTWAGGVTNFGTQTPTPEEFTRALTPAEPGTTEVGEVKFRGIRPVTPAASKPTESAVSLQLTFAFNSDQLSAPARHTLNNLGKALQGEALRGNVFRVEGHTDSKGSDAYNQRLSERRAQSVVRYLVSQFGIESRRLQSVGKGETELLHPNDPENPGNRRVQIVNLGS